MSDENTQPTPAKEAPTSDPFSMENLMRTFGAVKEFLPKPDPVPATEAERMLRSTLEDNRLRAKYTAEMLDRVLNRITSRPPTWTEVAMRIVRFVEVRAAVQTAVEIEGHRDSTRVLRRWFKFLEGVLCEVLGHVQADPDTTEE